MADILPFDRKLQAVRSSRPAPPQTLAEVDDFAPDQDVLGSWARRMFIDEDGPLCNPRHEPLREAEIGWLWTTAEHTNKDRMVAGMCQLIQPAQRKWPSARQHWQLRQWFGVIPDFVITISAAAATEYDDWSFCALVEHELCHAAQDVDAFGAPRFSMEGRPLFRTIAHDVEQFHDVVERYGARAAAVERMTQLANAGPTIGEAQMTAACGTCMRRTA